MTTESELIRLLADATRAGANTVDPVTINGLDRAAAYRVQAGILQELGAEVGMLKTGIHPDGVGIAAPIHAARVGRGPDFTLPAQGVAGLEVEVGVQLSRDVASSADVDGAIDHFFLGIEVCASRLTDRTKADPNGSLADSVSAYGYGIGPRRVARDAIDGLVIRLVFAGNEIYNAPAKHGFGSVLASLKAYADAQQPGLPLKAGTLVTTGSMCGLVPSSGPGKVEAWLGDEHTALTLV